MIDNFIKTMQIYWEQNIVQYAIDLYQYPVKLITLIIDISIVVFLLYKFVKITKNSKVWQLIKGIVILILVTALSSILNLTILNFILDSIMTWGIVALIVIFQPELRRGLEQLGTNKFTKFFGMDKDILAKRKEEVYKIAIAASELSKQKIGGLIVIERDIRINDIVESGIEIDGSVSPQLLVNIFVPNTPLHDGAVVISNNKIVAAACILPLIGDNDIAKEYGTRHRAALGISKESDAIALVVSEETGKISIAKDGKLFSDLTEESVKKMLIKYIVNQKYLEDVLAKQERIRKVRMKLNKKRKEENVNK